MELPFEIIYVLIFFLIVVAIVIIIYISPLKNQIGKVPEFLNNLIRKIYS